MNTVETVGKRIEELCLERNITISRLGYISGVANSTIKSMFYGTSKNPGITTLKKLCDGFEITLGEFFSTSEFDELEQEIK